MPTQVTFDAQYAANGTNSSRVLTDQDITITALDDDGIIDVGDTVTISGLPGPFNFVISLNDGDQVTYLGNGTFNGVEGFVFTQDGNFTAPDEVLVLTQQAVADNDTLLDILSFANGTTPQTLGTSAACFAKGTGIATPSGIIAVENLSIGDMVLTAAGEAVAAKWIGRQRVSTLLGAEQRVMPVRVRAGALGGGLPERDLVLTADHGLMVDGLLINAGALVNGTSIDYVPRAEMPDGYTVYHIETENHDVILAEGTAAETFVDCVGRKAFDNHAEYLELYGTERIIPEMNMPRISSPRLLPVHIKARLGLTTNNMSGVA